jgi:hypothetical protein
MSIRTQVSRHFLFIFCVVIYFLFAFDFALFDLLLRAIHSLLPTKMLHFFLLIVSLPGNFIPTTKTAKKSERPQQSLIRNSHERNSPHCFRRILMLCFPLPTHHSLSAIHVIQRENARTSRQCASGLQSGHRFFFGDFHIWRQRCPRALGSSSARSSPCKRR